MTRAIIDKKHLLTEFIPAYEEFNNKVFKRVGRRRRRCLKVDRITVYGIVTHDAASRAEFDGECGYYLAPQQQELLDWQPEQGDDEDGLKVLHHLKQLATTTLKRGVGSARPGSGGVESRAGTTTLVASVQSPTFTSCTQHRPPSSFRRYSFRLIQEKDFVRSRTNHHRSTRSRKVYPDIHSGGCFLGVPRIFSADAEVRVHSVIWLVQLDFVDLSSHSLYYPSSPRKRRRTFNEPFHQVSPRRDEDHSARAQHRPAPEAKRFKGVRYRADHNRWVAEIKPPKWKNKVWFGEFRSQIEAARVVDVAFNHFNRPLNFPDTPHLLSSLRSSAGLSEEAKLMVVRNQAQWMKTWVSSPNRSNSDTNSPLCSFSAIGSSIILNEADYAVSQPEPIWLQALLPDFALAEEQATWGVAVRSGDWSQSSTTQRRVETAMAHHSNSDFGISTEHFDGVLTTGASSQLMDFGSFMTVGYSAAPSVFPMWSQEKFQLEAADASWEQLLDATELPSSRRDAHRETSDDETPSEF